MGAVFISTAQTPTSHGAKEVRMFYAEVWLYSEAQAHTRQVYSNKILTSARNGELIMWDLNKAGPSKCGKFTSQLLLASLMPVFDKSGGYAIILALSTHWHIPLCWRSTV